MRPKNFADVLAQWQGGIDLKPGRSYVKILTKAEVLKIFGGIPTALTIGNTLVNLQEIKPEMFKLTARKITEQL